MPSIRENLEKLMGEIGDTAARAGRAADEIEVVGVTKYVSLERIQEAVNSGLRTLGENRIQEAREKVAAVEGGPSWHMIGHLQRNKVKAAVGLFDMVQSVDSAELAAEVDRRCAQAGRRMDVLVEVKTAREETKFGVSAAGAADLVAEIAELENIDVKGLMTIGTFTDDEREVRRCFAGLRDLGEKVAGLGLAGVEMKYLSMGMSSDFTLAIEEGSNMVRIGTAIFGARSD
jgi:pyridoxal phosphate enzyme (YggS family)